jgi:hypothetical protein
MSTIVWGMRCGPGSDWRGNMIRLQVGRAVAVAECGMTAGEAHGIHSCGDGGWDGNAGSMVHFDVLRIYGLLKILHVST